MNSFIEFIKRIFKKKPLALSEGDFQVKEKNLEQKESFLDSIRVENNENSITFIERQLEQGIIDETMLTKEQIEKVKKIYSTKILYLVHSINNYKLKLNKNKTT